MNCLVSVNFSNIRFLGPHFFCRGSPFHSKLGPHEKYFGSPLNVGAVGVFLFKNFPNASEPEVRSIQ